MSFRSCLSSSFSFLFEALWLNNYQAVKLISPQYSAFNYPVTTKDTPIVQFKRTCSPLSLLTLSLLGVLPRASYHVFHTMFIKLLPRAHKHLLLPTISCLLPLHSGISSSLSSCILIPLLIHVLPVYRSTCSLHYRHRRVLVTQHYPTTPFSWTVQVQALRYFRRRNRNIWLTTSSSTVSLTALLPSTPTAPSRFLPLPFRTFSDTDEGDPADFALFDP